ncbi:Transposable element Tc1 transposase-like 6 [Homarus americanus]|uniref:Transposable element Tc1 transposase-like 6 n=1 Tax=Homarus americanus TaxID=6706 RepID=A0A8J5J7U5_HOMAM|nr:Transposable element Tc1 transposase-like 6 [Homarus americanus]
MPGTNITREEKVRILTLIEEKVPVNEIVRRTGRNKATIHRLKAVACELPPASVPPAKPRSGRPRKTSKTTDALLRREVLKTPHITAAELQRNHPDVLGNVAPRIIQHRLQKELHLPRRRPAKKPLLTDKMGKARLGFARKYRHWTPQQWAKVIWSDESTVQCVKMSGNRVRRP